MSYFLGYGLYVNTTDGGTLVDGCTVEENGADGIKFVHHEEYAPSPDRKTSTLDFCTFPITTIQTFPIVVNVEQNQFSTQVKECYKVCDWNNFYSQDVRMLLS